MLSCIQKAAITEQWARNNFQQMKNEEAEEPADVDLEGHIESAISNLCKYTNSKRSYMIELK